MFGIGDDTVSIIGQTDRSGSGTDPECEQTRCHCGLPAPERSAGSERCPAFLAGSPSRLGADAATAAPAPPPAASPCESSSVSMETWTQVRNQTMEDHLSSTPKRSAAPSAPLFWRNRTFMQEMDATPSSGLWNKLLFLQIFLSSNKAHDLFDSNIFPQTTVHPPCGRGFPSYLHGGQLLFHLPVPLSKLVRLALQVRQPGTESRQDLVPLHQLAFDLLHLQTQTALRQEHLQPC